VELVRTGDIAEGERVVLVVTGSGLKPYGYEQGYASREIESDVDAALAALGVS
jgi:threonine synthase